MKTTLTERTAKLEQSNQDLNRRLDDMQAYNKDSFARLEKIMTNHLPHQINALSDKFDRRFDLQAGAIESVKNFAEAVDKRITLDQASSGDTKLVTKVVLALIGIILLAFANNLVGMVFKI